MDESRHGDPSECVEFTDFEPEAQAARVERLEPINPTILQDRILPARRWLVAD